MMSHPTLSSSGFNQQYQALPEATETRKTLKKSFLVFNRNKYLIIPTEAIALFYIKFDATVIVTADKKEYTISYS
ncbi:MAG: hypothetical protein J7578_23885, partial [Chitinophagaceae bacterium]|nr:hypothetical protein [Chitinophagaceae bacterium]